MGVVDVGFETSNPPVPIAAVVIRNEVPSTTDLANNCLALSVTLATTERGPAPREGVEAKDGTYDVTGGPKTLPDPPPKEGSGTGSGGDTTQPISGGYTEFHL